MSSSIQSSKVYTTTLEDKHTPHTQTHTHACKHTYINTQVWVTGLHQRSYESLKRCLLRLDLKDESEGALRIADGSVFQMAGAWQVKDLSPYDLVRALLMGGRTRSFPCSERRERAGEYQSVANVPKRGLEKKLVCHPPVNKKKIYDGQEECLG